MLKEAAVAYLLGSITPGYWLAKLKGIDIRKVGSGNIGATNVYRAMGIKYAALVGIFDILKAFIPAYFFKSPLYGFFAVLGHAFPLFLGFKGGKGIASTLGTLIAYTLLTGNTAPLIFFLAVWLNIFLLCRIMSLGTITATLSSFLAFIYTDPSQVQLFAVLTALIYYLHRSNIRRLMRGEEKRVERVMT